MTKKIITLALMVLLTGGMAMAQHGHGNCGNCPHHAQHHGQTAQQQGCQNKNDQSKTDGIDMAIIKAFPTVKNVKKNKKWTEVYDANKKLLGYAVYSKPASDGIKGYNGETPVIIALSPKQVIFGVWLLDNTETPKFAKKVEEAGFYKNWNGLTVKQALKKEVDVVSGATYTSNGVIKSVQAALKAL